MELYIVFKKYQTCDGVKHVDHKVCVIDKENDTRLYIKTSVDYNV